MSVGGSHLLRMVGGLNELNGGWWCIVVNGAHGTNDGFCGCYPLWVADCLNDLDWCG